MASRRLVSSPAATKNAEVVAAIKSVVPDAAIEPAEGRDPHGPGEDPYLDITRLREDTGYEPAYDAKNGVVDYIDWLRAGHER